MTVRYGLLVHLQAKEGREKDLAAFLEAGRALVMAEEGTVTWYAFSAGGPAYGIFDSFETEDARQAHLDGEVPVALAAVAADLLAAAPDIQPVDIVAVK